MFIHRCMSLWYGSVTPSSIYGVSGLLQAVFCLRTACIFAECVFVLVLVNTLSKCCQCLVLTNNTKQIHQENELPKDNIETQNALRMPPCNTRNQIVYWCSAFCVHMFLMFVSLFLLFVYWSAWNVQSDPPWLRLPTWSLSQKGRAFRRGRGNSQEVHRSLGIWGKKRKSWPNTYPMLLSAYRPDKQVAHSSHLCLY